MLPKPNKSIFSRPKFFIQPIKIPEEKIKTVSNIFQKGTHTVTG